MAIKPEGGGGKALMARPLREELFFYFAASLMYSPFFSSGVIVLHLPSGWFFKGVL